MPCNQGLESDVEKVQEAFAQMESNAAAAMAKFKAFSRPSPGTKDVPASKQSVREENGTNSSASTPRIHHDLKVTDAQPDTLAAAQGLCPGHSACLTSNT